MLGPDCRVHVTLWAGTHWWRYLCSPSDATIRPAAPGAAPHMCWCLIWGEHSLAHLHCRRPWGHHHHHHHRRRCSAAAPLRGGSERQGAPAGSPPHHQSPHARRASLLQCELSLSREAFATAGQHGPASHVDLTPCCLHSRAAWGGTGRHWDGGQVTGGGRTSAGWLEVIIVTAAVVILQPCAASHLSSGSTPYDVTMQERWW